MQREPWIVSYRSKDGTGPVKGLLEPQTPNGEECLRNALEGTGSVMWCGYKLRLTSRTDAGYRFTGPAGMRVFREDDK